MSKDQFHVHLNRASAWACRIAAVHHGEQMADLPPWEADAVKTAGAGSPAGFALRPSGNTARMATYRVNPDAVARARDLIDSRQYVLDSDWGDAQPKADAENAYLERHSWDDYATWHLGLTEGATDHTKARYAFAYGDLRRLHRTGLIACVYRAAEWRHKQVELAAHQLLQYLDERTG